MIVPAQISSKEHINKLHVKNFGHVFLLNLLLEGYHSVMVQSYSQWHPVYIFHDVVHISEYFNRII